MGIFSTPFWSLSLIFHSEFLNFHFPGISRFQIPENLEPGNSRKMKIQKFWVKNQSQWTKLSGKNSQYVAICQKWPFPDFLESGIWKFQQNENSNILREKSSLGTHTEWEKYLICCNLSKTAISREFPDFLEPGNSGSPKKMQKNILWLILE